MSAEDNEILVQPVKTFHGEEGFKTPDSEPFAVSRQRMADLKANELVVEVAAAEKAAPAASNKSAPTPRNKGKNGDAAD
ncbi:hypothetical protein [Collimonas pratensis]|uniref:Mu-like prophage FluMu N-terminal domain-containing protein n=1 Tax=Collimonas pratensis TaxID=279113 RepID=A0ABM5Z8Q5_9BURK|nr:hypothetical protein [Collimonas pratensis]AMP15494.1 hypothetical protein CPter291_3257 [Collimonas pratensis]